MCGIVAMCSTGKPLDREALIAGMRALRHRGPDGEGYRFASQGRVGLAHTRLSIIDHETGAQPILSENERLGLVVNGELYGFEAIRRELEAKGHHFRTRSDAEIALHLYEDHGARCLEHLRGEFAFVLWDEDRDVLFAARDRFGIKPLFYAQVGDLLYLASEAKALFAAGVPAVWNSDSVYQALFACVSQDSSLFRDVRQVPPGHYLLATRGNVQLIRYWDAEYPIVDRRWRNGESPARYVEEVRWLLDDAVGQRMRADVPVGCLLSGGLDSSTVLGLARRHTTRPMAAYTISFDDPEYDESALAAESAAFSGAELNIVPAGHEQLAELFEESVCQGEMLQYNAHGTARFLLSRAIAGSGYKSVLAGEGADELFAGYGFCRPAVLAGRSSMPALMRRLWRMIRPRDSSGTAIARTSPWLARARRAVDLPPELIVALTRRMEILRSVLSPGFKAQQHGKDPYRALFESVNPGAMLRGREPARQLLYLWLKTLFPGYVLAADRVDMAHGVEVRLPFLDHRLFERVSQIPVHILAHGGEIKHLLRQAAAPFIAPSTRQRLKKPLMAPPFTRRPGDRMLALMQDLLRSSTIHDQSFFDARAIETLLDDVHKGRATDVSVDPLLLVAGSLCVLQRRYRLGGS